MATISSKKLRKVLKRMEPLLGRPVFTLPTAETVNLFVAIFGRRAGTNSVDVLGAGMLAQSKLVLPDADVIDLLADGATPTSVGVAWVKSGTPHTEQLPVASFGMRTGGVEEPDPSMWAIELGTASTAPLHSNIPPGASPASAWCFLFPWVSFCQTK